MGEQAWSSENGGADERRGEEPPPAIRYDEKGVFIKAGAAAVGGPWCQTKTVWDAQGTCNVSIAPRAFRGRGVAAINTRDIHQPRPQHIQWSSCSWLLGRAREKETAAAEKVCAAHTAHAGCVRDSISHKQCARSAERAQTRHARGNTVGNTAFVLLCCSMFSRCAGRGRVCCHYLLPDFSHSHRNLLTDKSVPQEGRGLGDSKFVSSQTLLRLLCAVWFAV